MTVTDTTTVRFEVLGIERLPSAGRIVALANVAVDVVGVRFTVQGVAVARRPDGGLAVEGPRWRHPVHALDVPAVVLPPELRDAIGAEVLAAMGGG